jgi:hypothetical protein
MPFDLSEYDRAFSGFVHDTVHELARAQSPLLSRIAVEAAPGTASSVVEARDAAPLDLPADSVGFEVTMDVEAVRQGNFDSLVIELSSASEELGRELVGMLISTLNKVTESTGNVVNAGGKFTFEHFYEMLDKIEWSLTEDDELSLPEIVLHPDSVKDLPEMTREQEATLDELKRRKHEELLARRRRRRLS